MLPRGSASANGGNALVGNAAGTQRPAAHEAQTSATAPFSTTRPDHASRDHPYTVLRMRRLGMREFVHLRRFQESDARRGQSRLAAAGGVLRSPSSMGGAPFP
ncbi:hypothetical protein [Tahibacter caeni]|uniref:hypothetical protein n=1 Tax=Tahibacter caeni TaxID=1453545 RepID=UPI00214867D2|nr:hypothetical protein [Tahibacter caeni]